MRYWRMPERKMAYHTDPGSGSGQTEKLSALRLNENQKCAVRHDKGPMLVLAGPGSGKTAVITARIVSLIRCCHARPEQILTITFTKKAALEMRERAVRMDSLASSTVFGTFHAVFYGILQQSARYRGMQICPDSKKRQFLKEILYTLPLDPVDGCSHRILDSILQKISLIKNRMDDRNEEDFGVLDRAQFEQVYHAYNERLRREGLLDFDDMLLLCHEYLKKDRSAAKKLRERFRYIQIDEFQDINGLQYEIVKMLVGEERNLLVVGDDDQSIYGFRGAGAEYMRKFREDYEGAKTIVLDQNYRCHKQILSAALTCISHNTERFSKVVNAQHEKGFGLRTECFEGLEKETEAAVKQLEALKKKEPEAKIAFLYRTVRNGAFIEEELFRRGYRIDKTEKRDNFYDRTVVKDIRSCFCFLETGSRTAFLQFMNKPFRYLSREALGEENVREKALLLFYEGNERMQKQIRTLFEDLDFLKECDAYSACLYLMKKMGYERYVYESLAKSREEKEEFEEDFKELLLRLKGKSRTEFLEFAREWELYGKEKAICENDRNSQNKEDDRTIHVMTFHASKGLEFDYVFLTGLNRHVVPHKKAVSRSDLEEERRMFYVAMTRAKKGLWMSCHMENGIMNASPFLQEISEEYRGK
ncbi:MAG: ATP-dependent helicase [Lachnospiraceae bacterium]|nr:ATP-dependent helicase [Lachnospiraceae bacterium]